MRSYDYLSKVYDELMMDISYPKWADYIVSILEKNGIFKQSSLLEIGCGTGQMTITLKKRGFNITGVDISDEMLLKAEENARKAGVMIPFVCQDITALNMHQPVKAVVAVCDVINYIKHEKLDDVFRNVKNVLMPEGLFLFDISSEYKLTDILGDNIFFEDKEDLTYIWINEFTKDKINMDITIFLRENDLFRRYDEHHVQYIHKIGLIIEKLADNGFKLIDIFDCFGENGVTEKSERIQFVAQRT